MLAPTPIKPSYQPAAKFVIVKLDSPIQPAILDNMGLPAATRNSSGDRGVGNYSLKWRQSIASSCFAQIIAE